MAHQHMPKIFHGPCKNAPANPLTYLMYGPFFHRAPPVAASLMYRKK